MWAKLRKLVSLKKVTYFLAVTIGIILLYNFFVINGSSLTLTSKEKFNVNQAAYGRLCHHKYLGDAKLPVSKLSNSNSRTRQHALLFLQDSSSRSGKLILYLLQAARFKYHSQYGAIRNLPALIDNGKGRYATIIFEDVEIYLQMTQWNREILDKYCIEYDVGIVFFVLSEKKKLTKTVDSQTVGNFPLTFSSNLDLKDCIINPESQLLRVARSGEMIKGEIGSKWSVFNTNDSTYEVVLSATPLDSKSVRRRGLFADRQAPIISDISRTKNVVYDIFKFFGSTHQEEKAPKVTSATVQTGLYPVVLLDKGIYDRIRRVIFGNNLEFWMNKIIFLDALHYLSGGKLSLPLERYMQIDIDDIFVSVGGARMTEPDVMELIKFQTEMRERVPGFNFLLGFSGKFFQKEGTPEEKEGDSAFLRESHNFIWFPHMWSHMQAHLFNNKTMLCGYMKPNKEFAKRHKLNVSSRYAVAPHHSGIFPVHEPLYDCWRELWNIETTSTEEYPNLRPDTKRRGFIYKGIKVLPRQTCGLFTHTNFFEKYPGGRRKLENLIHGGQVFQTLLLNQYNIYMTHFSNYGNDRLALYLFDKVVDFVQCWTNLRLLQIPPIELAQKYFDEHPEEVAPVWTNPCDDSRHLEIWSKQKSCDRLPKFVIVGPQKTGTTALHWFLQMHPDLVPSKQNPQTYEEIQFFNSENYLKGLGWYMDFFPMPGRVNQTVFYEKSANYFSHTIVPRRLSALLPKAHVVVLLIDPAKRAYSWYQHMQSHNDPTAVKYSFYEVLRAKKKASPSLLALRARCLDPGNYADHIDKWLEYFPPQQVILEDGDLLAKNPAFVLDRIQKSLGLQNVFNYTKAVRFDERKGFFCQILESGATKCLGKGKGRQYLDMDEKSHVYLEDYFEESNKKLLKTLKNLGRPLPSWLNADRVTGM